jgi:hypothetical protein
MITARSVALLLFSVNRTIFMNPDRPMVLNKDTQQVPSSS